MMRARWQVSVLAAGAVLLGACGAILGLPDPALDDAIGAPDAGAGGANAASTSSSSTSASVSNSASAASAGGGGAANAPVQLNVAQVRAVLLDDDYLFWNEDLDMNVGRMKKDGTEQVFLASGIDVAGFTPSGLAIDDTAVYWIGSFSEILVCPKAGCANHPTLLLDKSLDYGPQSLALDAQSIYFGNFVDDMHFSIQKMPKAGGPVSELVAAADLCPAYNDMQLSAGFLYVTCEDGDVDKISASDGTIQKLVTSGVEASPLVVSSSVLFFGQWSSAGTLFSLPDIGGAPPMPIALNQPYTNGITTDDEFVYWTNVGSALDNGAGTVSRCAIPNCNATVTVLAKHHDIPQNVVVDAKNIYWADWGNGATPGVGIWRLAK